MPDVNTIPPEAETLLSGLDVWVLDALRRTPHPSHLCLEEALAWIERMKPRRGVLTNMHNDLDWATVQAETGPGIDAAAVDRLVESGIVREAHAGGWES